jgi:hypothetical protein
VEAVADGSQGRRLRIRERCVKAQTFAARCAV